MQGSNSFPRLIIGIVLVNAVEFHFNKILLLLYCYAIDVGIIVSLWLFLARIMIAKNVVVIVRGKKYNM